MGLQECNQRLTDDTFDTFGNNGRQMDPPVITRIANGSFLIDRNNKMHSPSRRPKSLIQYPPAEDGERESQDDREFSEDPGSQSV